MNLKVSLLRPHCCSTVLWMSCCAWVFLGLSGNTRKRWSGCSMRLLVSCLSRRTNMKNKHHPRNKPIFQGENQCKNCQASPHHKRDPPGSKLLCLPGPAGIVLGCFGALALENRLFYTWPRLKTSSIPQKNMGKGWKKELFTQLLNCFARRKPPALDMPFLRQLRWTCAKSQSNSAMDKKSLKHIETKKKSDFKKKDSYRITSNFRSFPTEQYV